MQLFTSYLAKTPLHILVAVAALAVAPPLTASGRQKTSTIKITANDEAGKPITAASVVLKRNGAPAGSVQTDAGGRADIPNLEPGVYEVTVSKQGFEPLTQAGVVLSAEAPVEINFVLGPKVEVKENVTVQATPDAQVDRGASPSAELQRTQLKEINRPATVTDSLPLLPGVVRSPEGEIKISGTSEHRSALVVNSADVTDPATGQFGVTVPVDSVETINVFKTPYLAQYGRFTAGVVSVETRRGSDKWSWELNDPLPEFRIRSGHLRGIREASPRINFSGPLSPNRFYISEGVEYELWKRPVRTLPFPFNETKHESINSFTQLDYIVSPNHTLTATFHLAPRKMSFVNLEFFSPQEVTPNFSAHDYTTTAIDRLGIGGALLESTIAVKRFRGNVWAQGSEDMALTPTGNHGNYFSQQDRRASRVEWLESYSLAPIRSYGTHNVKFGTTLARTTNRGEFLARPVNILDTEGRRVKRIEFDGGSPFDRDDIEIGLFGQDHWSISSKLAVDIGTRFERQGITQTYRFAPRAGLAWTPFNNQLTVLRGGFGIFYDRVPLNVYAFDRYPEQIVTTYAPDGSVSDGPRRFANITDRAEGRQFPFIRSRDNAGNFAPYSATWNVEVERTVSSYLRVRANYLQSNSAGVIIITPRVVQGRDALVLGGGGKSRYRQFETTARISWREGQQVFLSYVRSRTRGDINEFNNYLGNFPFPVVRPNSLTNLPGDLPNRFLGWGLIRLPWKMRIAPIVEYRNGFPFTVVDQLQNFVGTPNKVRFPNFFSLDSRVSKDFRINSKYSVRFTVSGFNLTNHFNPLTVHSNIDDLQFGTFFGNHKRRFRLDFDVLF